MGVGYDGGLGMTLTGNRASVVVIGGGLAGISAAIGLADAGLDVTLLEGRAWLGGATCSFVRRGLTIDNGQHVFVRSCVAYRDLLARLGVTGSCSLQDRLDLTVLGLDATARLRRSGLPAPLHLARSLASYRPLSVAERARVATAAIALQFADLGGRDDSSLDDWLARHGQSEHARRMLWDLLSLSALNVSAERADLPLAASAIRAAILAARGNADLGVPSVPLSTLHGASAAALLSQLRDLADHFHALADPALEIAPHVVDHAHLAIAAFEQLASELFGVGSIARQHAGEHERGFRAFEQLARSGLAAKRMQNQRR